MKTKDLVAPTHKIIETQTFWPSSFHSALATKLQNLSAFAIELDRVSDEDDRSPLSSLSTE